MFFVDKNLVAIDIGTSSIKLAEIEFGRKGAVLKKFGVFPLEPNMIVNGEIAEVGPVSQCLSTLIRTSKTKRKQAAVAMWGSSLVVKKISMPKMEASLVAEQIKWEAEQYIPFDVNEVSLEHFVLQNRSVATETMEVLLVAAKQELIFRYLETIEGAGIKCSLVDVCGFALANCFEANYGVMDGMVALLNIGAASTNLVVVDNGDVVFNRDVAIGGLNFSSEINKQMGVSLQEAESLKISASIGQEVPAEVHSIIASMVEQVTEEIRNSFEFFTATASGAAISRIFVSGGSIFVPGLVDQISKAVNLPYEVFDPFLKLGYDKRAFTPEYISQIKAISPIAIGLGLRKIGDG